MPDGYEMVSLTDTNGVATFEEVPASIFTTLFDAGASLAEDGGKSLYKVQIDKYQVKFGHNGAFEHGEPDGFIIESTLVEGYVMQHLSDSQPASFVKIAVVSTSKQDEIV